MSDVTSHQSPAPEGARRFLVKHRNGVARAKFVLLSRLVLHDRRLSPTDKIIYAELDNLAVDSSNVWPSQHRLAVQANISVREVQRSLERLENLGLITTRRRPTIPSSNVYTMEPLETIYPAAVIAWESKIRSLSDLETACGIQNRKTKRIEADDYDPETQVEDIPTLIDGVRNFFNSPVAPPAACLEDTELTTDHKSNEVPVAPPAAGVLMPPVAGVLMPPAADEVHDEEPDEDQGEDFSTMPPARSSSSPTPPARSPHKKRADPATGTGSVLVKKATADEPDLPRRPGANNEPPEGYNLRSATSVSLPTGAPAPVQVRQPTYAAPQIESVGKRVEATKAKQDDDGATGKGAVVFRMWQEEVRARHGISAGNLTLKPGGREEWSIGKSLYHQFGGENGLDMLRRTIRLAVWDWDAAREHEVFTFLAKRSDIPTIRDIAGLVDKLQPFLVAGITSRSHRMSNYAQRFVATTTTPTCPAAVDPLTEIAQREGKGRAQIHREILAGLRPDPRQPPADGSVSAAG